MTDPTDQSPEIIDDTEHDDTIAQVGYDITSYGIDFDVDGIVRRLDRNQVVIPSFQRSFVWKQPEASRFVESLLLGLPVPGIFLARDNEDGDLLVIDGQQRLRTLQYFKAGFFNPDPSKKTQRVFKLMRVRKEFEGKTYEGLTESQRRALDDSVIHATVVKQDSPADDDTSVYHIFERLNSGGRRLTDQEIRTAISHGPLIDLIRELNDNEDWRAIYGKPSDRLKDQEMILRFLALHYEQENYERPMGEFLSKFAKRRRRPDADFTEEARSVFEHLVQVIRSDLGTGAVRPERGFNAAHWDALAVGLARRLAKDKKPSSESLKAAHQRILNNEDFQEAASRSTADKQFVNSRLKIACDEFAIAR